MQTGQRRETHGLAKAKRRIQKAIRRHFNTGGEEGPNTRRRAALVEASGITPSSSIRQSRFSAASTCTVPHDIASARAEPPAHRPRGVHSELCAVNDRSCARAHHDTALNTQNQQTELSPTPNERVGVQSGERTSEACVRGVRAECEMAAGGMSVGKNLNRVAGPNRIKERPVQER